MYRSGESFDVFEVSIIKIIRCVMLQSNHYPGDCKEAKGHLQPIRSRSFDLKYEET